MTISDWTGATTELQVSVLSDMRLSWSDSSLSMQFEVFGGERRYNIAMHGIVFFKSSLVELSDGYTVVGVTVKKIERDIASLLHESGYGFTKFDVASIEGLYPLYYIQVDGETCIQALAQHIEWQTERVATP